jgi:hypothetical protein
LYPVTIKNKLSKKLSLLEELLLDSEGEGGVSIPTFFQFLLMEVTTTRAVLQTKKSAALAGCSTEIM